MDDGKEEGRWQGRSFGKGTMVRTLRALTSLGKNDHGIFVMWNRFVQNVQTFFLVSQCSKYRTKDINSVNKTNNECKSMKCISGLFPPLNSILVPPATGHTSLRPEWISRQDGADSTVSGSRMVP